MTVQIGDQIPNATLITMGEDGPHSVEMSELVKDKTVLLFAVPGAFTPTCTKSHLPGYVDNSKEFFSRGVDAIYCVTVNDAFVADAWADMIGAKKHEVQVLADAASDFTGKMGMRFDGPPVGLYNRSKRYAMLVKNGEITALNVEENPGVCELSSAETMLEAI